MKTIIFLIFSITLFVVVVSSVGIHIEHPNQNQQDNYIQRERILKNQFDQWVEKHAKKYHTHREYLTRYQNFKNNLKKIEQQNAAHQGSAKFGMNKFSDLSEEEFTKFYLMPEYKPTPRKSLYKKHYPVMQDAQSSDENIPLNLKVDWRTEGLVTPVKDQGACGSCWAFSATEQIETAWIKAGNDQVILSEQQIVDCDTNDGGCGGGDPHTAMDYVIKAGGLTSESQYPYIANDGTCHTNFTPVAHISGYYAATTPGNDTQLAYSVMNEGPISICVDASSWMTYSSGIIRSNCDSDLDHCVQIVGLNVDTNGTTPIPYYIIRNSWGTDWGIDGFIYVEIGHDLCGVTQEATIVVV
ncbi:hypothetical protein DLAC_08453 [Tieghemostelium lacteum]|uniref:Cysteine proteinase n=1 Tax=Tieghemostelium lacteum TaxID=361077 RepID=A0A151ZC36_TIELA|nr:hypothetical protein DLAC_08453 [Tieghemostelium lacteum]|eukprot:KYQ91485.1 hypothetical protein DLAC_08453 [Tieghemostelium lacteum]